VNAFDKNVYEAAYVACRFEVTQHGRNRESLAIVRNPPTNRIRFERLQWKDFATDGQNKKIAERAASGIPASQPNNLPCVCNDLQRTVTSAALLMGLALCVINLAKPLAELSLNFRARSDSILVALRWLLAFFLSLLVVLGCNVFDCTS
jgi:hypothetical protein